MNFTRREGPFVAEITGSLLSARRETPEEGYGRNGAHFLSATSSEPLFVLPVAKMPWFVMHGDGIYAQNSHDALAPLYRGSDAAQLLWCLTDLLTTVESKRIRRSKLSGYVFTSAVASLAGILLISSLVTYNLLMSHDGRLLTTVDGPSEYYPAAGPSRFKRTAPEVPAPISSRDINANTDVPQPEQQSPQPQPPMVAAPSDGWSLPLSVRAELPAKLRNAASRGLFTVPLSSGHARTVYVFSDPACPNCQRMERYIETAAGTVNVVIFPVTIKGGEDSLKTLTPVMALPEAKRPAAWKRLFDVDTGIGVPGSTDMAPVVSDENQAETARGAIGVNEVAFRAYRLPGTPWTISDDGRYVPQSVLSSPAALTEFLNGGSHDGQ